MATEQNRSGAAAQESSVESSIQDEQTPPNHQPQEVGGPKGPEPTRYGDWERKGRCIDF